MERSSSDELKTEQIKVVTASAAPAEEGNSQAPIEQSALFEQIAPIQDDSSGVLEKTAGFQFSIFLLLGAFFSWAILVLGQFFMIADIAVSTGTIASALFGLSYDRIMYHCGAQDTFLSGFIFGVMPIFWSSWFLYKRRVLRYVVMAIFALPVAVMMALLLAPGLLSAIVVALLTLAALFLVQLAGSYFASFQLKWPRRFTVTRLLLASYIPAIIVLAYEFINLDLNASVETVNYESMGSALGAFAAFSFLPSLLNSIAVGSRRFASGFGLASIGQFPVLMSAVLYTFANAVMLISFHAFGSVALQEYFARMSRGMPTEFELNSGNAAELWAKLLCSLLVCAIVFLSVVCGSFLGVAWNRFRRRAEHSFEE